MFFLFGCFFPVLRSCHSINNAADKRQYQDDTKYCYDPEPWVLCIECGKIGEKEVDRLKIHDFSSEVWAFITTKIKNCKTPNKRW